MKVLVSSNQAPTNLEKANDTPASQTWLATSSQVLRLVRSTGCSVYRTIGVPQNDDPENAHWETAHLGYPDG